MHVLAFSTHAMTLKGGTRRNYKDRAEIRYRSVIQAFTSRCIVDGFVVPQTVEAPDIASCDDQEITLSPLIDLIGNLSLTSGSLGLFKDRKVEWNG